MIWRYLANFWTFVMFIFLIFDYSASNKYDYLVGPLAAIYLGILGLFVGTKEFNRWQNYHDGKHPGEIYVILWTVLVTILIFLNIFINSEFRICSEIIATYLTVLGVFAITQRSKTLHRKRHYRK